MRARGEGAFERLGGEPSVLEPRFLRPDVRRSGKRGDLRVGMPEPEERTRLRESFTGLDLARVDLVHGPVTGSVRQLAHERPPMRRGSAVYRTRGRSRGAATLKCPPQSTSGSQ